MRKSRILSTIFLLSLACAPDMGDDAIPVVAFPDIIINTLLPEYASLQSKGYQYINDGGVRGIFLYRVNSSTYYAFERNCSYHPNDACATVDVDASGLFLKDSCCGSTFDLSGNPTGGPAFRPLRKYANFVSGSEITITDQIE